jgi:hypothetical protein
MVRSGREIQPSRPGRHAGISHRQVLYFFSQLYPSCSRRVQRIYLPPFIASRNVALIGASSPKSSATRNISRSLCHVLCSSLSNSGPARLLPTTVMGIRPIPVYVYTVTKKKKKKDSEIVNVIRPKIKSLTSACLSQDFIYIFCIHNQIPLFESLN